MTDAEVREESAGIMAELTELTEEFFRSVSFSVGDRPNYGRIRALFLERGLLIKNSSVEPEVSSVEEFIASRQALVDNGELTEFEEVESSSATALFGRVAHRWCTYTKRGSQRGTPFEARGVITTQFILTTAGWKMTSMAWDDERPGFVMPDGFQ